MKKIILAVTILCVCLVGASCSAPAPAPRAPAPTSMPAPTPAPTPEAGVEPKPVSEPAPEPIPEPAPEPIPEPLPAPGPTPVLITTEYYELPRFSYIGITPPPGKAHDLYNLLVEKRHQSNWSSLYTEDEFDCSEMSGFLELYLESWGFDTYILVAELTGRDWASALGMEFERLVGLSTGGKIYHAWVVVKIDNEYLAVEATLPGIDTYYGAYKYQGIYRSVEEAEKAYPGEFDFMNSSQFQNLRSR